MSKYDTQLVRQILRFDLTGGLMTILVALSFWGLAELMQVDPNMSFAIVFAIFLCVGFVIHSVGLLRGITVALKGGTT